MELSISYSAFRAATPVESVSIPKEEVERELLKRALGKPFRNRLPTLIPMFVIAYAAMGLVQRDLMLLLIGMLMLATVLTAYAALRLQRILNADQISEEAETKALRVWLFLELVSGAIWGLMIAPMAELGGVNQSSNIISVVISLTLAMAAVIAADARQLIKAMLIGFAMTAIPVTIYHYQYFGPYTLFAVTLFSPALYWIGDRLGKRALESLHSEMENVVLNQKLSEALSISEYLSAHDSLTGLLNRRDFERVTEELRTQSQSEKVAIIMVDLDNFKQINDQYGHSLGDDVLRTTARLMRYQLRDLDISNSHEEAVARWGGEEFIIAVANCGADDAVRISENIRCCLESYQNENWPHDITFSGSFGGTCWLPHEPLNSAIKRADEAMYLAKSAGRNRTRFTPPVLENHIHH